MEGTGRKGGDRMEGRGLGRREGTGKKGGTGRKGGNREERRGQGGDREGGRVQGRREGTGRKGGDREEGRGQGGKEGTGRKGGDRTEGRGQEGSISHNHLHIDGLVQKICSSSVLAMEWHLSCTNPSTWAEIPKSPCPESYTHQNSKGTH